jgi:Na+-transporting NADH:ubiquinone oxidoreductase subunit C
MKDRILMLIFILVTGTVLTVALVAVNAYTAPLIARNDELKLKRSILTALHIPFAETTLEQTFADSVTVRTGGETSFYRSKEGIVAFEFAGSGLWGPITGTIALQGDYQTISDLTILHQEETPGLGSRIIERQHLDKFRGRRILPALVSVATGKQATENDVDAITGATLSCNALIDVLNRSIAARLPALKEATQ